MLLRSTLIPTLFAVALTPAAARDREPESLARTGKWVVDYDRDACHLIGQFGTGKALVVARFTRYEPGDWFSLSLYGDRLKSSQVTIDARIDFGLVGPRAESGMGGNVGGLSAAFFSGTRLDGWERKAKGEVAPRISPQQEAAVKDVTVAIRGKQSFRLETGPLDKAFAQMRHCSDGLVRSWGYDPAVQASLSRPVTPLNPPGRWLNSSDYPSGALASGHNGMVQFRLDVDAQGKVVDCYVLARTNPDDFADATCRAVKRRAKLQPALDANGNPIRSFYVQKVAWLAG